MSGLQEIQQRINPKCPNCRCDLNLGDYAKALFKAILADLRAGAPKVQVTGFGVFTAKMSKPRDLRDFDGNVKPMEPRRQLRFKASSKARDFLNDEGEG